MRIPLPPGNLYSRPIICPSTITLQAAWQRSECLTSRLCVEANLGLRRSGTCSENASYSPSRSYRCRTPCRTTSPPPLWVLAPLPAARRRPARDPREDRTGHTWICGAKGRLTTGYGDCAVDVTPNNVMVTIPNLPKPYCVVSMQVRKLWKRPAKRVADMSPEQTLEVMQLT